MITEIENCPCELNGEKTTIKDYLKALLSELWSEGESFSGKHPFGNSGWEYDLYEGLAKAGLIDAEIDEGGYLDKMDTESANKLIFKVIDNL